MSKISFSKADILIPKNIDGNWPVIACDQYTSEKEYWEDVKKITDGSFTALNMVLPECYLEKDNTKRINKINKAMENALNDGKFDTYNNSLIFVNRTQFDGKERKGIIGKIDLNDYSYEENSDAEIRATEKTVLSRIPPRVKIRENAPLELPHVMLLIDDPDDTVISLAENENNKPLYDLTLMKNGGKIKGEIIEESAQDKILSALAALKEKNGGLLFCVGDGNHSLATAKECYLKDKNDKNRYALVEIVNIHSPALEFEPIYRTVFNTDPDRLVNAFLDYCGGNFDGEDAQKFTVVTKNGEKEISVKPKAKLPIGTLQGFLDEYLSESETIDYIHGEDSLKKLAKKDNAVGFIFKGMEKGDLFPAVLADGSLPRKTFSMGHADDKRFYLELRKIK